MTAQTQALQASNRIASASKVQVLAVAVLAGTLVIGLTLATRIAAPAGATALSDRSIGIPSGGLAGPSRFVRPIGPGVPYPGGLAGPSGATFSLGVPFPGGVAGPSLFPYVPHYVHPPTTRLPLRITGPLHPPRNTTRGVDPVQKLRQRMA
jgi:uncharacterized membrane protein